MTPERTLLSLINLFDTYKNNELGLHIPGDDCMVLLTGLKKLVEKYNINFEDKKEEPSDI